MATRTISQLVIPVLLVQLSFAGSASAKNNIKKEIRLSIKECVKFTVRNNLELLREELSPQIRSAQIIQEQAVFDPSSTLEISKDSNENLSPSTLAGAVVSRQENIFANMGIKKKLSSGATVELTFKNKEFRSNSYFVTTNPYYESNLFLEFSQPLLENFGPEVNEAQITIAVNNRLISSLELKQKIIDIVSNAQKSYWDVVFAHKNLQVKELYLQQAQNLLKVNQAKVAVGDMGKLEIEILEAKSNVAARQAEVIAARNELEDAEDKLKDITNLAQKGWELRLIPTDEPCTAVKEPSVEEGIKIALKYRPDYLLSHKKLLNDKINMKLADNKQLPDLKLIGRWGLNGLGSSYGNNLEKLSDANYTNWMIGVNLEIPWGNREADSLYLQKKLSAKQTEWDIKAIIQKINLEIREVTRQIKTDLERIQATRIAREMEEKTLVTVETMNKVGEEGFTDHTVMEYQTQLAEAKTNYLKAVINYNKTLIDFEVKKGTILEKNGIKIKENFPGS